MALSNSQYDSLMRIYQGKQARNQQRLQNKMKEIYLKIPELSKLDDEMTQISLAACFQSMEEANFKTNEIQEQLLQIKAKRERLLKQHGFTLADLEPTYDCKDCKDTGYINHQKCHCFTQKITELLYQQSHLQNQRDDECFEKFCFDYYSKTQTDSTTGLSAYDAAKKAYQDAFHFSHHLMETKDNMLIFGSTGVGKTFLSSCIAKEAMKQGISVIYFTAFEFFDILEKNVFRKNNESIEQHEQLLTCDLLIIDDLGTEFSNSFTDSQLFLCLNERLLRKKSTLISTNLSMKDLAENYSERTFSRIFSNYRLIKLFGDDLRIQKKLNQ